MAITPLCLVRNGPSGTWESTYNGVNISASETIDIRLGDPTGVTNWWLEVLGTDELSATPTLTNVDPTTHLVTSPTATVSFTTAAALGRSFLIRSRVDSGGGGFAPYCTFTLYVLTADGLRVGSAQETIEGNALFGWAAIVNPAVRRPTGSSFTAAGDLSGSASSQTVTGFRGRPLSANVPNTGDAYLWNGTSWTPGPAGGGGGFTAGGDLTGTSTNQTVSFIRGIESMDPTEAADNHYVQIARKSYYSYPYAIHVDGDDIFIMEAAPGANLSAGAATRVWKFHDDGTGYGWTFVASHDFVTEFPTSYTCQDLAWDSTYIYVGVEDHVAILNKSDLTIAGWAYCNATAASVCVDGSGGIYVAALVGANPWLQKFILADCLGQPMGTVGPDLSVKTDNPGVIQYGNGHLWLSYGWINSIDRFETSYLTVTGTWTPADSSNVGPVTFALGSIWVARWDWSSICTVARIDSNTLTWVDIPMTYGEISQPKDIVAGIDTTGADAIFVADIGWTYRIGHIVPATDSYYGYYDSPVTSRDPITLATNAAGFVYAPGYELGTPDNMGVTYFNLYTGVSPSSITYPYHLQYADVWQLAGKTISNDTLVNGQILYYSSFDNKWLPSVPYGDVQGTFPYWNVVALRGYPLRDIMPTNGQVLTWNSTFWRWEPTTPASGGFTAGGDLSGTSTNQTVIRIRNVSVSATAPTNGQVLQYSSGSSAWVPTTPIDPFHMTVTLGETASADAPMYIDESRVSASPGLMAYPVKNAGSEASVVLESADWTGGPTQPYAYDACAIKSDLYLVAYRINVSGSVYLRLRAISYVPGSGVTVGAPVDIDVDGASNEVAYVSCTRCSNDTADYIGGVVAWSNPTVGRGYILGLTISGTTITTTTVTTFRTTAVVGTGLCNYELGYPQQGGFTLVWADSTTNTGLSQWGVLYMGTGGPTLTLHDSPVTFTNMAAADIGQIVIRGSGGGATNIWATYGLSERRVISGTVNYSAGVAWNYAGATGRAITESRVDVYDSYGGTPGYILTSAQYNSGDFLCGGNAAHILTGTRAGFTDYLYLVQVQHGDDDIAYASGFTHTTKVIGGGLSTSFGTAIQNVTLRGIGPDTFVVAYTMATYGNAMTVVTGRQSPSGGLVCNVTVYAGAPAYYIKPLGTAPQNYILPFRITDYFYGTLQSGREYIGPNDRLRFSLFAINDARSGFVGFLQTAGNRGDSRVITLPGGTHTFSSATLRGEQGQRFYLTRYGGITVTHNKSFEAVGILTSGNALIVQKPARTV